MHLLRKSCATADPVIRRSESVVDIIAHATPVRAREAPNGPRSFAIMAGEDSSGEPIETQTRTRAGPARYSPPKERNAMTMTAVHGIARRATPSSRAANAFVSSASRVL